MAIMEDEMMEVSAEQAAVWNDDEDIDFVALRANEAAQEEKSEQPEDTDVSTEDSDDDTAVSEESSASDEAQESQSDDEGTKPVLQADGTYKVKANGMEFDFTVEELKALAPKAMDYTKKMQEIAPWRKSISAMKEQGLGEQDINLMIDVLKGDKNAIAEVLKRTQVDPLELDVDVKQSYQPNQYGKDESVMAIEEVVNQISMDPEYKMTESIVDNQWDSASRREMLQNPDMIMGLHMDIKNGVYAKVAPEMLKMKVMDGGRRSDLEYYQMAGERMFASQPQVQKEMVVQDTKQADIKVMADKRKAASPTKKMSGGRSVIDYLDENDEQFDDWYKSTMSKV